MNEGTNISTHDQCKPGKGTANSAASGGIYGLAFIGALVYYIQHAQTFWMGALGVLKALIWPAMLVYKLLESLKI
ncbi:MAG: hypothetical protein M1383_05140 [Patescibacteria group bacterium]|nr:hypothetical protein [Patescibacteria group bacterium]